MEDKEKLQMAMNQIRIKKLEEKIVDLENISKKAISELSIANDKLKKIEEDKPIEKLSGSCDVTTSLTCRFNNIEVKVNEIIEKLNKLEEGKK